MKKTLLMLAVTTVLFAGVPVASAAVSCGYDTVCGYGNDSDEGGYGTQAPGYGDLSADKDVYGA